MESSILYTEQNLANLAKILYNIRSEDSRWLNVKYSILLFFNQEGFSNIKFKEFLATKIEYDETQNGALTFKEFLAIKSAGDEMPQLFYEIYNIIYGYFEDLPLFIDTEFKEVISWRLKLGR